MRVVICLIVAVLAVSCQRDYQEGQDPAEFAHASHPWDFQHSQQYFMDMFKPVEQSEAQPERKPSVRGPALSDEDLLDPETLPGRYIQICAVGGGKISPVLITEMDIIEFYAGGRITYHSILESEDTVLTGFWEKLGPGMIGFRIGSDTSVPLHMQQFGRNFFYYWTYEREEGHWFARIPEGYPERMVTNVLDTSQGKMHIESVNEYQVTGTVQGEYERTIQGVYYLGMLIFRWEEEMTATGGWAVMRSSADGLSFDGVWWIDDYEAAPFGGPWTASSST